MANSYLISGARTPIGSFLGGLSSLSAPKLGGIAIEGALSRAKISVEDVDEVIMGNVIGAGVGQAPARQAALAAGLPNSIAAVTVNKVCGSGLKAVMFADQAIRCGDSSIIVAGGMENMSAAPHLVKKLRGGIKLGDGALVDAMVSDGLTCAFESCHMGMHAEHIANKFSVTREEQDSFSAGSQQRAAAAIEKGVLSSEIVPVTVKSRKGETVVDQDECVRADSTAEGLAKLRPVFDKEGTVTAGNASTLSDGAAAVVVASEEASAGAENRFKVLASHTSGVEPKDLFIAPVEAVRGALSKAGLGVDQVDLFEINEAFASQMLACLKELELDTDRVNIWGGGISLGHPIGASGARVLVTLMNALTQTNKRIGVASLCLGGGNAVAMVIEACE
jgi:acetyl-CoA C-acetyltransferase